jgi:hypothetical protein
MNEPSLLEQARIHLPKYLSPEKQDDLWSALRAFPDGRSIYSSERPVGREEILQGDGWRGFVAINFHSLERKTLSGIVISNSCDIDLANAHALSPSVVFAPLISLSRYVLLLQEANQAPEQIESHCRTIRQQRVASIFYLPPLGDVLPERIVLLSDVHGHPLGDFAATERSCLFTLNQFGFYLFLVKLSIHFTRMQKDVER